MNFKKKNKNISHWVTQFFVFGDIESQPQMYVKESE